MIHNPLFEKQSVDTIPLFAYLDESTEVEIQATIVNNFLVDLDLRGLPKEAFQSLYDDVKAGLELYGFKISGRDSIDIDI